MTPPELEIKLERPRTKRFHFFTVNLRRAYRSFLAAGAATNFATHQLYNASVGDAVLVVRGIWWSGYSTAKPQIMQVAPGAAGTHAGSEYAVWAGERTGNGQHWYQDDASLITAQFLVTQAATSALYGVNSPPLAVLPPGWALSFAQDTAALTTTLSFYWEELHIDDPELGSGVPYF
jgi:hypothetical protein